MLSAEHLFVAGLGADIAGAYLVSRGLLAPIPQLATLGGTIYALERPRAPFAVEDRIRGTVGLVALLLGFVMQAAGYVLVLARSPITYGPDQAALAAAIALAVAAIILTGERAVRPRWRDRLLIRVARFDWESGADLRDRPAAHVLRAFGEQSGRPKQADESDVAYCQRVFEVDAEAQ